MRINVLLFASAAEAFGSGELSVDLAPGATAGHVRDIVLGMVPDGCTLPPLRMAVNLEFADDSVEVREGDEVAVIPPVAGG